MAGRTSPVAVRYRPFRRQSVQGIRTSRSASHTRSGTIPFAFRLPSRFGIQGTADRISDIYEVRLVGRVDVDSMADVERRVLSEFAKTSESVRGGRLAIEVPGMSAPLKKTVRRNLGAAQAVDVDDQVRRSVKPVGGSSGV